MNRGLILLGNALIVIGVIGLGLAALDLVASSQRPGSSVLVTAYRAAVDPQAARARLVVNPPVAAAEQEENEAPAAGLPFSPIVFASSALSALDEALELEAAEVPTPDPTPANQLAWGWGAAQSGASPRDDDWWEAAEVWADADAGAAPGSPAIWDQDVAPADLAWEDDFSDADLAAASAELAPVWADEPDADEHERRPPGRDPNGWRAIFNNLSDSER